MLVLTTIIAIIRIAGITNNVFKDIAHIWVGILFGLAIGTKDGFYSWLAIMLSLVELICFLILFYNKYLG